MYDTHSLTGQYESYFGTPCKCIYSTIQYTTVESMYLVSSSPVEVMHMHVFDGTSHTLEVLFIADGLEVSTTQKQIHFEAMNLFQS